MNSRTSWAIIFTFVVTALYGAVPQPQNITDSSPDHKLLLKEGTDVRLKFAEEVSSKTASEGDPVNFVLDEDIKVGDVVVARAGAKAVGTISNAKKAGMMGKGRRTERPIGAFNGWRYKNPIAWNERERRDSKTGTAIALTVLFGPIGLIKHGKDIVVKEGTPLSAFVDEDVSLPPAK